MLDLLVGMHVARRLTDGLLAYDESPRGKARKRRRGSSRRGKTVSPHIDPAPRSVERSRDTPTGRPASSQASLR
jgi:hypothetical protein